MSESDFQSYGSFTSFGSFSGKRRPQVGSYFVGKTLGEGSFGIVRLGVHATTRKRVALKFIQHEKLRPKDIVNLEREKKIAALLDHPNIVKLYDTIEIEERNLTCLAMEYVRGGELFDHILSSGRLSETEAIRFFRQIVSAVEYCHQNLIVHRDLKPENLLLDDTLNIKIADFGLSNFMKLDAKLQTFCGSPLYSAPELLQKVSYIGPEVDVWAMGVILYAMVYGYFPWVGKSLKEQLENACKAQFEMETFVSKNCRNLIHRMLVVDPKNRATLAEIREHPWVNLNYETLPPSVVPRHADISAPNPDILKKMEDLGFKQEEVTDDLKHQRKTTQAYVLYFLLEDHTEKQQNSLSVTEVVPEDEDDDDDVFSDDEEDEPKHPNLKEVSSIASEGLQSDEHFLSREHVSELKRTEAHLSSPPSSPPTSPPTAHKSNTNTTQPPSPTKLPQTTTATTTATTTTATATTATTQKTHKGLFGVFKKGSKKDILDITPPSPENKQRRPSFTLRKEAHGLQNAEENLRVMRRSPSVETTTTKSVQEVCAELERVLTSLDVSFKISTKKGLLYKCTALVNDGNNKPSKVTFDMEVGKLESLGIKAIKFNRRSGDTWKYRDIATLILRAVKL